MKLLTPPFAQGRTSEIYAWDNKHVLKLYRPWCPPDWAEYEARIARLVYEAGVPSPKSGEIVEVDGRYGLIYERLTGISMVQDLKAHPWRLFKHARSLAELQFQIHEKSTLGLPAYKDRLLYDIDRTPYLTDEMRRKAHNQLDQLPDGQNICHGDFHPENVLITRRGPVVIDWMTACYGRPWADVARTSLILTMSVKAAGEKISPLLRMMVRQYHRTYLQRYRTLREDRENELHRWLPVVAAARLSENIIPERETLLKMVQEGFPY